MKFRHLALLIFFCIGANLGCQKLDWKDLDGKGGGKFGVFGEKADLANDWYRLQLKIITYSSPQYSNAVVIRLHGYEGIALYESLQPGMPGTVSLSESVYQMPVMPKPDGNKSHSWLVAANAAMAAMTKNFLPALTAANIVSIDSLENAYNNKLKPNANSEVFARSQTFGKAIAQAVFDWSKTDKFNVIGTPPFVPTGIPGEWAPTPPANLPGAAPNAGNMRPFFAGHTTGLSPAFPISYSTDPASDFYKMEKGMHDLSISLTQEQKDIALYWNDLGTGIGVTPPGHSISIIAQCIDNESINLGLAAMAYAKCGMGLWDGFILVFRSKYQYKLLRPITYIRANFDPNYLSYIPTPNHPEYPAAHAYITSAAMAGAAAAIGNNHVITDHTYDFVGYSPRSFTTLLAVGEESGISRMYGGIHYPQSITTGVLYGQKAGNDVGTLKMWK